MKDNRAEYDPHHLSVPARVIVNIYFARFRYSTHTNRAVPLYPTPVPTKFALLLSR